MSCAPQVLELSHRPLHLRQGDFYSYLSLSSHDSDCGELTQRWEEQSSSTPSSLAAFATPPQGLEAFSTRRTAAPNPEAPPLSPDAPDEETLFPACTEEVYLGPPLCYSLTLAKTARRPPAEGGLSPGSDPRSSSPSACSSLPAPPPAAAERRGEDPNLPCDVAESVSTPPEESSRNEAPPYLNPRARVTLIDSSAAARRSPHTKALQSNMGAVMTKISVCSSATNPSKEPAAAATHINPQINCSPMRAADREEEQEATRGDGGRRRRSRSQQEAAQTQVSGPGSHVIRWLGVGGAEPFQSSVRLGLVFLLLVLMGTSSSERKAAEEPTSSVQPDQASIYSALVW